MNQESNNLIRWMTYLMFLMFAMTTDAVGIIIPEIVKEYGLSNTKASLFHSGPMVAIALAGILLGFLADRLGRKKTIIIGLGIFSITSYLFALGDNFYFFLALLVITGAAIGIFKTAALALIGDISRSTREHTSTVNGVEAFFGVGAILGTLVTPYLISQGISWKWLYVGAGVLCTILVIMAFVTKYPKTVVPTEPINVRSSFKLLRNPYALLFSAGAFLYVSAEAAIFVWMPSYLQGYTGNALLLTYALMIFFVLRAAGRFLGIWMMGHLNWRTVLLIFSGIIVFCFVGSIVWGKNVAIYLLPLSGLFMSVIYPTINSKGISCFPKHQHGSIAGIILFFTAGGAAIGPLIMGVVSDYYGGDAKYGFMVAAVFAALLFLGLLYNYIARPVDARLDMIEQSEYG